MKHAYWVECSLVGDIMCSRQGVPWTSQSVLEISSSPGICWSLIGPVIHYSFSATHPEEKMLLRIHG